MRSFLPLRLVAVVASGAAASGLRMIEIDCRFPGNRRVAAVAAIGRENVIGRFRGRPDFRADAVACTARARCAFEDRIRVARFAGEIAVLA